MPIGHKWWCDGQHDDVAYYRTAICEAPRESRFAAIAIPQPSKADLDAAASLMGYHPTHQTAVGTPFCSACATNLATHSSIAMAECPRALPPKVLGPIPAGVTRKWSIAGSKGNVWTVEERIDRRTNQPYLYCHCPAWRFGGTLSCKHTAVAAQEK